jgi:chromosomal replication initiator protein
MQTYQEQLQHYRAVRARIMAASIFPNTPSPEREPAPTCKTPPTYAPELDLPPAAPVPPHVQWGVPRLPPHARAICVTVCQRTGVQFSDMASAKRTVAFVKARQRAFFALMRCGRGYSLPQIGKWFGGRDHTTVLHGVRTHEVMRQKGRCR